MKHPDECNGDHQPILSIAPSGECKDCGTSEREAWAMGESMWTHMHDYVPDGPVSRCECSAWLLTPWVEDHAEEGRASRDRRLARMDGAA